MFIEAAKLEVLGPLVKCIKTDFIIQLIFTPDELYVTIFIVYVLFIYFFNTF